jgi:hypothetical protein
VPEPEGVGRLEPGSCALEVGDQLVRRRAALRVPWADARRLEGGVVLPRGSRPRPAAAAHWPLPATIFARLAADAIKGTLGVHDAPGEPGQVPDDQRPGLPALDPLDAPVPEGPRGVPAAPVQLLDDLHQLEPFALADSLDALTLEVGRQEGLPLSPPTRLTLT